MLASLKRMFSALNEYVIPCVFLTLQSICVQRRTPSPIFRYPPPPPPRNGAQHQPLGMASETPDRPLHERELPGLSAGRYRPSDAALLPGPLQQQAAAGARRAGGSRQHEVSRAGCGALVGSWGNVGSQRIPAFGDRSW